MIKAQFLEDELDKREPYQFNRNLCTVEIRRARRDEDFNQRRAYSSFNIDLNQPQNIVDKQYSAEIAQWLKQSYSEDDLPYLVNKLLSDQIEEIHEGAVGIRKLSTQTNLGCLVTQLNVKYVLERILELCTWRDYPQLVMEATWIMANLLSHEIDCLAVSYTLVCRTMVFLLQQGEQLPFQTFESLCVTMGNLAVTEDIRDVLLQDDAANTIVRLLCKNKEYLAKVQDNSERLSSFIWLLSCFCRGQPKPDYARVELAIMFIAGSLKSVNNEDAFSDSLASLANHITVANDNCDLIVDDNIPSIFLAQLKEGQLSRRNNKLMVRILGNIAAGQEEEVRSIVEQGGIRVLAQLLEKESFQSIWGEITWVLSNIAASGRDFVVEMVEEGELINLLTNYLKTGAMGLRTQIIHFFISMSTGFDNYSQYLACLQAVGLPETICSFLRQEKVSLQQQMVGCIANICTICNRTKGAVGEFYKLLQKYQGITQLEELQYSENKALAKQVEKVLNKFYDDFREETSNEILMPKPPKNSNRQTLGHRLLSNN